MGPEVLRALIIAEPVRVHELEEVRLASVLQNSSDLRAGICAAAIAVLVELAVALVRPAWERR